MLCSVYTHSPLSSPHREGELECDVYITNTFKEIQFFSCTYRLCVSVSLKKLFFLCLSLAVFLHLILHMLIVSPLFVSPPHRTVQTLADKSKQEALRVDLMDALKRKHNS